MIVDASALVALLAEEPDAQLIARRLGSADPRLTHPISIYEASTALARIGGRPVEDARGVVQRFLRQASAEVVSIGAAEAAIALQAHARYGKGRHPAALNMGDCFSYAVAKLRDMPLLYKGEDFALTDLAS